MRIAALVISIFLFLLAYPGVVNADKVTGSIQLSSNPSSVAADGKSLCTISAQVRDRQGNIVPDGTEVRFSSSLGVIEDTATTRSGVARVKLISGTIKGTAVVTATWIDGQAVAQMNIVFGDQSAVRTGPEYITIEADDYLAYSPGKKMLDATGNVHIKYRGISIEALSAQIDLDKRRVVAKGDGNTHLVKIRTSDGVLEGNTFFSDLAGAGVLISASAGVKQIDVSSGTPVISHALITYQPDDFNFADLSDSPVLVKAKQATVFLGDRVQFKKADVYIDGKRMLRLPLYVLSMNGYEVDGEQYVGYSSNGVTVNLPVYYSLSTTSTGAMLVRHGTPSTSGWYGDDQGWSLDLREKYATDKSQGSLEFSQVTSNDWGAHFSHSQQLDQSTRTYMYLDFPAHKDLFGNLNLDKTFRNIDVGMDLYGSRYSEGMTSMSSDVYVQTHAKPVGRLPFRYTLSSRVGYSEIDTGQPAGAIVPTSTTTDNGNGFTESLQGNLNSLPFQLTKKLSLSTSMALGYLWSNIAGDSGLSTVGTAMLDWRIAPMHTFQLNYRYADRSSIYTSQSGSQSISANWRYTAPQKWLISAYAIKGLDYSSTNLLGNLSYKISRPWRLGVQTTWNKYGSVSYSDLQLVLGFMMGSRELVLIWSKSQDRFMFELGSGAF